MNSTQPYILRAFLVGFFILSGVASNSAAQGIPTIAFLGDSLTAGYGIGIERAYPALIKEKLAEDNLVVNVINAGVSGDTSAGGLRRVDWILQRKIDVLVVALGANDMLRGHAPEGTQKNLIQIIEKAKSKYPGIKILVAGMKGLPSMGKDYSASFENIFSDIASQTDSSFAPFLLKGVAGEKELNLSDRIHPNEKGHKLIAEHLYPYVKKIITP